MLRPETFALTLLLAMLTALGPLSVDMYLASLPAIERSLSATTAEVQLTISIYLFGFAFAQMLHGPLSDRYGRRPVLLTALCLYTVATLACLTAPSIFVLIGGRCVQAMGGAGATVIARAIVRDLYTGPRAGRELSLMGATMALAPTVAPMIGGALQIGFGWRANFVLMILISTTMGTVVWKLLPETVHQPARGRLSILAIIRGYRPFLQNRSYLAYVGIIACTYGGMFSWISGSAFVLQQVYGLTPVGFGLAFGITMAGYMIGTLVATKVVMRLGLLPTVGIGTAVQAIAGVLMLVPDIFDLTSPAWILGAISLYLGGMGLTAPQSMAGALTPYPKQAGTASSLFGFVQQIWSGTLGAAVGAALVFGDWPMAAAVAVMGVGSLLVWATATERPRRSEEPAAG